MSPDALLLLWLFLSGALALVSLGWAVLAALAEGTVRGLAWALLVITALLAAWPAVLSRWNDGAGAPFGPPLLVGMTLILAAAMICLGRLRQLPGTRLPARLGIGAALNFWLALVVAVLLPA